MNSRLQHGHGDPIVKSTSNQSSNMFKTTSASSYIPTSSLIASLSNPLQSHSTDKSVLHRSQSSQNPSINSSIPKSLTSSAGANGNSTGNARPELFSSSLPNSLSQTDQAPSTCGEGYLCHQQLPVVVVCPLHENEMDNRSENSSSVDQTTCSCPPTQTMEKPNFAYSTGGHRLSGDNLLPNNSNISSHFLSPYGSVPSSGLSSPNRSNALTAPPSISCLLTASTSTGNLTCTGSVVSLALGSGASGSNLFAGGSSLNTSPISRKRIVGLDVKNMLNLFGRPTQQNTESTISGPSARQLNVPQEDRSDNLLSPTQTTYSPYMRLPAPLSGLRFFRQGRKTNLEQLKRWKKSMDYLLSDPMGVSLFHAFLKTEYSQENIEFWLACESYKELSGTKKMTKEAQRIYQTFLSVQAPQEINLDSKTRLQTIAALSTPTKRTFDNAQKKIYALMEKDSFPRFLRSEVYQNALREAQANENS